MISSPDNNLDQGSSGGQAVVLVDELHLHGGELGHHQLPDHGQPFGLIEELPLNLDNLGALNLGLNVLVELAATARDVGDQDLSGVDAEELADRHGVGRGV